MKNTQAGIAGRAAGEIEFEEQRELSEEELVGLANEVITEFAEDWSAGRHDLSESIIEDLAMSCQILYEAAGRPQGKKWLALFHMLFGERAVVFSMLAKQLSLYKTEMNDLVAARHKQTEEMPRNVLQNISPGEFDLF